MDQLYLLMLLNCDMTLVEVSEKFRIQAPDQNLP